MSPAYQLIRKVYGDRRAARSGRLYMDHIDEGVAILKALGACSNTQDAFMVHPIAQDSNYFAQHYIELTTLKPIVVLYAMEYARVANNWLRRDPPPMDPLSPIPQVNLMLIADKVQNKKDFIQYYKGIVKDVVELSAYFDSWLRALGISESRYHQLVKVIQPDPL